MFNRFGDGRSYHLAAIPPQYYVDCLKRALVECRRQRQYAVDELGCQICPMWLDEVLNAAYETGKALGACGYPVAFLAEVSHAANDPWY